MGRILFFYVVMWGCRIPETPKTRHIIVMCDCSNNPPPAVINPEKSTFSGYFYALVGI